ncbi:MAG: Calx-beta domain-containing protein, partial [Panacagrimonas sp.]
MRDNRVELKHAQATEWYVNSALGLEHGYTFERAPQGGRGEVRIQLALDGGFKAQAESDGIVLTDTSGTTRLRYHKLLVLDANQQKLDARLDVQGDGRLLISFNDTDASYPVIVDPLLVNEEAKLVAADGAASDTFGFSVAVAGDTAVVGAREDDVGANSNQGSAYVFVRSGTSWTQQAKLVAADGAADDRFGFSVALSGDAAVVGTFGDDFGAICAQGSAYVFVRSGTSWTQQQKLVAADGAAFDEFGISVALSGDAAVVGAHLDDLGANVNQGSAYVYRIAGNDFGDAIDPRYPTLLASNGARHSLSGPKLGTNIDAEPDGQPNLDATGDDINGIDDEDGVTFGSLSAGDSATVNVLVTGGPALLDGWIDFNRDFDWTDPGEQIFDDFMVLDGLNQGLVFQVPGIAESGNTSARMRLSSDGVADVTGPAPDGEVEDLRVSIGRTLSVADARIAEGDTGTRELSFTVSLSQAKTTSVSVSYATSNETATAADGDYTAISGTLTFTPGQTTKSVRVLVTGDRKFELDESLRLTLSAPSGATIEKSIGFGTITNDDSVPTVSITPATRSLLESAGSTSFTLQLSNPSYLPITLPFSASGTASSSDYSGLSASPVMIAAEGLTGTISLNVVDDPRDEPDQTVTLNLGLPTNAILGSASSATLTIEDNDGPPTVSFTTATQSIGEGPVTAQVTARLSIASEFAISVPFGVFGGSTAGVSDYSLTSVSPLTIPIHSTEASIAVGILDDELSEGNETVVLDLGTPIKATLAAPSRHTLTIVDDTVQLAFATATVNESGPVALIGITRAGLGAGTASVTLATTGGTATAGSDYTPVSQTVTWANGDTTTKTVSIPIIDDETDEPNEDVTLVLSTATGASNGEPRVGVLTIVDNDRSAIQLGASSFTVNEAGPAATITLTRTGQGDGAASVRIATSNGTATAGSDYTAVSQTVSWANRELGSKTVNVPVTSDTTNEADETVNLTLSNVSGDALGSPSTAVLTIIDNDTVQLSAATYSVNESGPSASITLSRIGTGVGPASVRIATSNGSATAGSDYSAVSQIVSWTSGDVVNKTVSVPITSDMVNEADETVNLALSNVAGAALISPSTAVLTITGRVEKWRGGGRRGLSVSGPFGRRCPSSSAMTPFPLPARRTGR